jgi:drug/metabolite transporter (DMT)-like permease
VDWFALSIGTAFFTALAALFNKYALRYWPEPLLLFVSSAVLAVILFSLADGCELGSSFFQVLPVSVGLHIGASLLTLKALKSGELSAVFPLINLTPVFMFITSPLIGGEFPQLVAIPGILLIVVGAYLLQLNSETKGFLGPLKALWYLKGARYMLGTAFLWSLAANVDKIGVLDSSPEFWGASVKTGIALFMIPACLLRFRREPPAPTLEFAARRAPAYWLLLIIPLVMTANILCNMKAYELTLAINVVSVKRLCSLFSVLLGWYFMREQNIRGRLLAAGIMVGGVLWMGFVS